MYNVFIIAVRFNICNICSIVNYCTVCGIIIKYFYEEGNLFTRVFTKRQDNALDMQDAVKGFHCAYEVLFQTGTGQPLPHNG